MRVLGSVVAGEHDECVLAEAQLFDCVEDLADVVIHLGQRVGPVAVAGAAGEVWMRQRRIMHERERHVGEERPLGLRVAAHEIDGSAGDLGIDQPSRAQIVHFNGLRRGSLLRPP